MLAEAVYAVLEVKPEINRKTIQYAASKAQSVRRLERTTHSIVHSDQSSPTRPKSLFPILAGLVAIRACWRDGLHASSFSKLHAQHTAEQTLSLGLALEDQAFALTYETFDLSLGHGALSFSQDACSLAWFLFTLLKRLQDLGTCPAVDWLRYREVLGAISEG